MTSLHIAVLTGRRPELLARTLDSFTSHHRDVWDGATRTVMHNSGDPATVEVLDRYDWHDRHVHTGPLLRIGQASQILGRQVADADADVVLRLEDDWEAAPVGWFDTAVALLDYADQVRLVVNQLSPRCKVCRQRIEWRSRYGHLFASCAHYTHTPSLMRRDAFLALFPYRDEPDAMRKFHGRQAVQQIPGVFTHIGGGDLSLKKNGGGR